MARIIGRLTARQVATAKPPKSKQAVFLADGGNLLLQITRGKADHVRRSWCFRYELAGRRREMGLGPYPDVTLATARAHAHELRAQLRAQIDPLEEKAKARRALLAARAKIITFRECAESYIALHGPGWGAKHLHQWQSSLQNYVFPRIGALAPSEIDSAIVFNLIEPLWTTKTRTAARVLNRIECVWDHAATKQFCSADNPARCVASALPKQSRITKVKHHSALPYAQVPAFMAKLRATDTLAARALELLILCASRSGETLGATWTEIDIKAKLWTIGSDRMKSKREHRVPLSSRALDILHGIPRHGDRLFPIGRNAMGRTLEQIAESSGVTTHGFRSSFRDWCAEATAFPNDVIEMSLAHVLGTKTEQAYLRTDLFSKRVRLMQQWSSFCSTPAPASADTGSVVPIRQSGTHA